MKRFTQDKRPEWEAKVESLGFTYHTSQEGVYWNEGAYYTLTMDEVEAIEEATGVLHSMCLDAVERIIHLKEYHALGFTSAQGEWIAQSWNREDKTLYGRFDLGYDGENIKAFEYNSDTPTGLLEAAVIQWEWFEDVFGGLDGFDQFNSIHDRLVERWKEVAGGARMLHFAHLDDPEDAATVGYLRDCAEQAGLDTTALWVDELGLYDDLLVDTEDQAITHLFKLYPWECLFEDWKDLLGKKTLRDVHYVEPAWKALLSSKAIWAYLWKMYPNHKYLLETHVHTMGGIKDGWVRKPFFSREGANVEIAVPGYNKVITAGPYGDEGSIVQKYMALPFYDGKYPVLGSWVVGHASCGLGIRESYGLVTTNTSQFVPHIIHG